MGRVAREATAGVVRRGRFRLGFFARKCRLRAVHGRARRVDRGLGFGEVAFADGETIESVHLAAGIVRLGFGAKVILEVFPVVAALEVGPQRATLFVAAMDHAVLAARIARHAVHDAVFLPIDLFEHLPIARVVAVGHEVAGGLPALDVPGGNGPGRAGQFAFAGQKFLIDRRAENGEARISGASSGA